jgi:glycosyltransferase involved in cell wall biosynthesis
MSTLNTPRFTIILPSYNGGEYLKSSVASVLRQSFTDFELAILDDGSTDGSLEWLQSLTDNRAKLYPSPKNLGIVKNWRRALEIPKGEFITFLGHDDLFDSNFLEVMDALIRNEPDASLYHAHFRFIDADGKKIACARPMPAHETAAEYVAATFAAQRDSYGTGYVFRSALHDEINGFPPYPNLFFADDAFWISVMSRSYKATAQEECFSCRRHSSSLSATNREWRAWIDAMIPYIEFLDDKGKSDADFQKALYTFGYEYFLYYCRVKYLDGLVQETESNRLLDPSLLPRMEKVLSIIHPETQQKINVGRNFKIRECINRYAIGRKMYNSYIQKKHKFESTLWKIDLLLLFCLFAMAENTLENVSIAFWHKLIKISIWLCWKIAAPTVLLNGWSH